MRRAVAIFLRTEDLRYNLAIASGQNWAGTEDRGKRIEEAVCAFSRDLRRWRNNNPRQFDKWNENKLEEAINRFREAHQEYAENSRRFP